MKNLNNILIFLLFSMTILTTSAYSMKINKANKAKIIFHKKHFTEINIGNRCCKKEELLDIVLKASKKLFFRLKKNEITDTLLKYFLFITDCSNSNQVDDILSITLSKLKEIYTYKNGNTSFKVIDFGSLFTRRSSFCYILIQDSERKIFKFGKHEVTDNFLEYLLEKTTLKNSKEILTFITALKENVSLMKYLIKWKTYEDYYEKAK